MNIFGLVLSIFILLACLFTIGVILFDTRINGYIRIVLCTIGIIGVVYYIMFIMQTFWV